MKRKTNKKSGIIAAVVGLSAVSLVSVGFASWVMSADKEVLNGTISVETVDDQRFLICRTQGYAPTVDYGKTKKAGGEQNASSICFGIDDSTPIDGAWLTAGGEGENAPKYENLTATVSFYVAKLQKTEAHKAVISATLAVTGNTAGWTSAVTKTYVAAAPTTLTCVIGDATFEDTEANLIYRQVTAEIEFGWGDYFIPDGQESPVNPYVFYNHQDATASSDAKTVLKEIETLLNGVNFTVTITTDATKA